MTVYDAYFTGKEGLIHFQKECGYFILCISYFLLSIWVPFPDRKSKINTVSYPNQIRLTCPEIAEILDRACNPPSPDVVVMSALFLALFHGLFHGLMEKSVGGAQMASHRGSDLFFIELFSNMILGTLVAEAWRFVREFVY